MQCRDLPEIPYGLEVCHLTRTGVACAVTSSTADKDMLYCRGEATVSAYLAEQEITLDAFNGQEGLYELLSTALARIL